MSHFTVLQTRILEVDGLVAALADLGFAKVEVHPTPQPLFGYRGDRRPETAEVIIRRASIGPLSNDIGFRRRDDGTFDAIISKYDRTQYSKTWIFHLAQRYAYQIARSRLEAQGFDLVSEENAAAGGIRLVLRRLA